MEPSATGSLKSPWTSPSVSVWMTVGATLPAAAEKLMGTLLGWNRRRPGIPSARVLVRVSVLRMGRAVADFGPVLVSMVHQGRHAVDQHHAHAYQQQLRDGIRKGYPFVHLRHQIGHRDIEEAAGGNHQDIRH